MSRGTSRSGIFLISWLGSLAALGTAALLAWLGLGEPPWLPWAAGAALAAAAAFAAARLSARPLAAAARAARALAAGEASGPRGAGRAGAELAAAFGEAADSFRRRLAEAGKAAAERAEALSGAMDELHARDETRAREGRMAAKMQRRIVPRPEELPERRESSFGAIYLPAENTGGDLYDAARAGKNGLALLAADVSGRGVTAALIAAMVKNAFRVRTGWDVDPAALLGSVGSELQPILGETDHFVTAFYALLDLETGLLRYAAAGHPPALHFRRRLGKVEELDAAGPPLGLQAESPFAAAERRLEEGDRVLLYTDGLTGARNYRGEPFGRERLAEAFLRAAPRPASEAAGLLSAALESFLMGAPRGDDVVALVCEFRSFARPEDAARRRLGEREDWHVLARRGAELAAKGKVEEAVGVYERILEIEPSDAASLNNLGTLYWRLGRREEAAARFEAAARIDPEDPRIKRNLILAESVFAARSLAAEAELAAGFAAGFAAARAAAADAAEVEEAEPADAAEPSAEGAGPVAEAEELVEEAEELVEEAEPVEEAEAVEEAEPLEEAEAVEEAESLEEL